MSTRGFAAEAAVLVCGRAGGREGVFGNKGFAGLFAALCDAGRARGRGGVAAVFPDVLLVLAAPFDVEEAAHGGLVVS